MSPIEPTSLDTDTPRTTDGRRYPDHLKAYEKYDRELLGVLERRHEVDAADLAMTMRPRARFSVHRWLASATWRGLVTRTDDPRSGLRRFEITPRGRRRLSDLRD